MPDRHFLAVTLDAQYAMICFYRAMIRRARSAYHRQIGNTAVLPICQGKLSVRPSVSNVDVSWSYTLEFLENNFTAVG